MATSVTVPRDASRRRGATASRHLVDGQLLHVLSSCASWHESVDRDSRAAEAIAASENANMALISSCKLRPQARPWAGPKSGSTRRAALRG